MKTITVSIKGILHPLGAPTFAVGYAITKLPGDGEKYAVVIRSKTIADPDIPAAIEAAKKDFPDIKWHETTAAGYYGTNERGAKLSEAYTMVPFSVDKSGAVRIDPDADKEMRPIGVAMRSFDPPAIDYGALSSDLKGARTRLDAVVKKLKD